MDFDDMLTDEETYDPFWNDPEGAAAYDAYCLAETEHQELLAAGLVTDLMHCYLCYLEQTGHCDISPRADQGPLRGIASHSTAYGFSRAASARQGYDGDPYDVIHLIPCGHALI